MEVAEHKPSLGRARKRERPSSLAIEDPNPYAPLATGATGSKGEGQASAVGCKLAIGNLTTGLVKPIGANRTMKLVTVSPIVEMATVGRVAITLRLVPFLGRL